jgi:hypothetical protein
LRQAESTKIRGVVEILTSDVSRIAMSKFFLCTRNSAYSLIDGSEMLYFRFRVLSEDPRVLQNVVVAFLLDEPHACTAAH